MNRRRITLLSTPILVALAACQPVVGDPNDNTPPAIRFQVAGATVAGLFPHGDLPAEGVTVVASDPGGMTSLDVTNILVYDCVAVGRREVHSAQLIDIPATAYSTASHSYHSPSFGEFWPDTNTNGVNDPAEWVLRFDDLIQPVDFEYFQSWRGIETLPCTMTNGTAGTAIARHIIVEAYAVNHRGSIVASDAATAYDELVITIAETD